MAHLDRDPSTDATPMQDQAPEDLAVSALVEEVSIDGMCGVY